MRYVTTCMANVMSKGFYGRWVVVAGLLLSSISCRKPSPDSGRVDLQALGVGIGRELCEILKPGDHVVVLGMPGAVGFAADIQAESVKGISASAKDCGVNVVAATYTKEEVDAYFSLAANTMHPEFAAGAIDRAGKGAAKAVISLVGRPTRNFLPDDAILVLIEWNPEAKPRALDGFKRVMVVVARDHSASASGHLHVRKNREEALAWFDQRFRVEKFLP